MRISYLELNHVLYMLGFSPYDQPYARAYKHEDLPSLIVLPNKSEAEMVSETYLQKIIQILSSKKFIQSSEDFLQLLDRAKLGMRVELN